MRSVHLARSVDSIILNGWVPITDHLSHLEQVSTCTELLRYTTEYCLCACVLVRAGLNDNRTYEPLQETWQICSEAEWLEVIDLLC